MLINIAQTQLFLLAITRVLAMLIQIPVLGGQMIPLQVRLGFGLLLTAILIPWGPLPLRALPWNSSWQARFSVN
jgi:flagellar biosynthesis protein FliR